MNLKTHSHSRQNLLTGDWVLVSPQRTQRPWQGQIEATETEEASSYDAECYLCPGNKRANGNRNPEYTGPYVFDNDFPALSSVLAEDLTETGFFRARAETGKCRVVCFSHLHHLRLARMSNPQIEQALRALIDQFVELDQDPDVGYVQIFENHGQMMGCSNAHPHGQIWATRSLPMEPAKELRAQRDYRRDTGGSLLLDYLTAELDADQRVVCENEHFVALVPFWAVWPFETLLLPRRAVAAPDQLEASEVASLADLLKQVLGQYDRLFSTKTPYSMGFHPRPSDGGSYPEWQFHAHIYPPLLRSATIRKHMVGFEMLACPQRDLTPEVAAQMLRSATESSVSSSSTD